MTQTQIDLINSLPPEGCRCSYEVKMTPVFGGPEDEKEHYTTIRFASTGCRLPQESHPEAVVVHRKVSMVCEYEK